MLLGPRESRAREARGILPKMHPHVILNRRVLEASKARMPAVNAATLYGDRKSVV